MSSRAESSDRYVTRRIRDDEGNIIVKRYKKQSGGSLNIPWNRVPSGVLGVAFGVYALIVNLYRTNSLNIFPDGLATYFQDSLSAFTGLASLFLTGIIAVGIATFLGFALFTRGFRIKKWPTAARQLLAIVAIILLFTAVFSSFLNEIGITRHQDNQVDANEQYDLSNLSAPFYSELLDGLLDLIGNVQNPDELVATITPGTQGDTFDANQDQYLWRWLVAETYGNQEDPYDFYKGFENYRSSFDNADETQINSLSDVDVKKFNIDQQYLTLGSAYSGEALSTWNSQYDSQINIENLSLNPVGAENPEDVELVGAQAYNNLNSQPIIQASISETQTSGYIGYDAYFIEEEKNAIVANSSLYDDVRSNVDNGVYESQLSEDRFGDLSKAGTLKSLYGEDSLPNYYQQLTQNTGNGDPTGFNNELTDMRNFAQQNGLSVFDVILELNNKIQGAVLNMFNSGAEGTLDLSSDSATQYEANPDEDGDRAFYFWNQVANDEFFGVKDAIAGYVNILRMLNIPARPILGFSVGDVQSSQIEVRLEHIHVWIEALIPWMDDGELKFSWGAFNPIPNFNYLTTTGDRVFGRNSLGSTPELEIASSSGVDQSAEEFDSYQYQPQDSIKANQEEPTEIGARISFDGVLSGGQRLDMKFMTEDQITALSQGNDISGSLSLGTTLGEVRTNITDPELWANFTLTARATGELDFTYDGDTTTISNASIQPVNLNAAEGSRNIYAIVAQYGLFFEYILIGWTLNGTIDFTPLNTEILTVNDASSPAAFGTGDINSMYTFFGEERNYSLTLNKPASQGGGPMVGVNSSLLFMSSNEYDTFTGGIDDLSINPDDYKVASFPITNSSGMTQVSFTLQQATRGVINLANSRYYTFVAYVDGTTIYKELIVHITDNVTLSANITTSTPRVSGENVIYEGETITYSSDVFTWVNDSILDGFLVSGTQNGRFAEGLILDYYIFDYGSYQDIKIADGPNGMDQIDYAAFLSYISSTCTTDVTTSEVCYQLTTQFGNDPGVQFGIVNGDVSKENSPGTLDFTWGVVPNGYYYILIHNSLGDVLHVNATERISFAAPGVSRASIDVGHSEYYFPIEDKADNDEIKENLVEEQNILFGIKIISTILLGLIIVTILLKYILSTKQVFSKKEELL